MTPRAPRVTSAMMRLSHAIIKSADTGEEPVKPEKREANEKPNKYRKPRLFITTVSVYNRNYPLN